MSGKERPVTWLSALCLAGALWPQGPGGRATDSPPSADSQPRLRRPVALVLTEDGKRLFVANRRSGTVSVIDTEGRRVVAEVEVGRQLADLVAAPDHQLLAVDEGAQELVRLSRRGDVLKVVERLAVATTPVSVRVTGDGSRCVVASLWPRQLTVVAVAPEHGLSVVKVVPLPFAPRRQLPVDHGRKLVVADSFGGQLAVVDLSRGAVESVRSLPAHNIRSLVPGSDGRSLCLTHQFVNPLAETSRDDIHWGNLLTNNLRAIPLSALEDASADLVAASRPYHLGEPGRGAGDPSGLAIGPERTVVTLAGTGEIAVGRDPAGEWQRLAVGRGPTTVVLSADGRRAFVANTFDDSVSVVDFAGTKVVGTISLGSQPPLSPSDRGEVLFHDARLSHDGWFSCHSCHTDGHSNGRLADTLGDGSYGTPKRVLSLLGVKDTGPWAWNGSMPDLEDQIRKSQHTTMRGPKATEEQIHALTAFLKTLPPPVPVPPADAAEREAVRRGRDVFRRQRCDTCHAPPTFTTPRTYDVGLTDEAGETRFNPPSLRGVRQGGPFFHDGRAATLEEVVHRFRHQIQGDPGKQELEDLLVFLRSL